MEDPTYPPTGIWFWIYAGLGFIKSIYICICWHVFYPKVAAINRSKLLEKFNKETKLQKTNWDFIKYLFFDINNLVGTYFEPFDFGKLRVGQLAPAGRLYTLENKETDVQHILSKSVKTVQVLNFGSYS